MGSWEQLNKCCYDPTTMWLERVFNVPSLVPIRDVTAVWLVLNVHIYVCGSPITPGVLWACVVSWQHGIGSHQKCGGFSILRPAPTSPELAVEHSYSAESIIHTSSSFSYNGKKYKKWRTKSQISPSKPIMGRMLLDLVPTTISKIEKGRWART